MDRFGIEIILPTEKRVATIARLCERGHAGQIVLSHDAACYFDWYDMEAVETRSRRTGTSITSRTMSFQRSVMPASQTRTSRQ